MKELITIFDSKSKTYKTPLSPTDDKTFTFQTLICSSNLEMYSLMSTHFILNIPILISKPTKMLRQKSVLEEFYQKTVTYVVLDIDEVKSEFNKQLILDYFKNYKVILGESRSYDGYSNFNLKGILFTEEIPVDEVKNVLAELTIELSAYCKIDESAARRPSLNAPMLKNKVFINNEDGIRYKYIKKDNIEKINEIKKEYLTKISTSFDIPVEDLQNIEADSIENLCLKVFQSMGFQAMKNNGNGSITFKHPSETKSPGGYFWFQQSPYTMHHFNTSKNINIFDTVRKLDVTKNLLRKDLNYNTEFLNFNINTKILKIDMKFIEKTPEIEEKIHKFLHAKNGLLGIRSPMGTGKSKIISHVIEECHEQDMKVLIITNRISVAQDFAKKYNMKLYNSDKYEVGDSLVVQFDSLWRYNIKFFDIVIMDEFISLMLHSRNNLNNNSINIAKFFGCFQKKLVIADAFLTGYENFLLNKEHNVHLIDNIYRDGTELYNYSDLNAFSQQLVYTASKQKITISSTSISFINSMALLLKNKGLKVITLTADTMDSTKKLIYDLFEKDEHDKWDVLIYSPTLTVGVSNMNNVYSHFHYDSSISTDVISSLQMIKRTRKAKEIHLFIKDKINYLKTNYNDIRDEYMQNIGSNIDNNYLFELDNYGEPRLSDIGKKAIKIDAFKNILEFNHKEAFFWLCKYHFNSPAKTIETKFESNILGKYQKIVKDEREENIKRNIEDYLNLNNMEKSDIIMGINNDKVLKILVDIEENISECSKEIKSKILELSFLDSSFIQKCKYFKTVYLFSKGILTTTDIKYKISEAVMRNKDDLYFYNTVLDNVKSEIYYQYSLKEINKNKKLKYILEKCGYRAETGDNWTTPGDRNYILDENIKQYNGYII